jgi:hypothetical protein
MLVANRTRLSCVEGNSFRKILIVLEESELVLISDRFFRSEARVIHGNGRVSG